MSKVFKIRKGKDIQLEGAASRNILPKANISVAVVKPTDFKKVVPKPEVQVGDEVKAGDVLFHDKNDPRIKFTSPISGEVTDIVRGNRRAILEFKVLADKDISYKSFDVQSNDATKIKETLLASGLWPCIIQRPFGVLANPDETPKAIYISTFDSAPLAQDYNFVIEGENAAFQKGLDVLSKLTSGKVHLNHAHNKSNAVAFTSATGVQHNFFDGPHPAGLVGVQIHHIDPINKGDVVWTLNPQSVIYIGRLFLNGTVDMRKRIALCGSDLSETGYVETISGASIESIVGARIKGVNSRIISGNVLTGTKIEKSGFISFYDNMVTVIPEGDHYEFFGWLVPSYPRPTISNSLPISKFVKKSFVANTNTHGEERAFVMSGQYEKVLPMDIMPVHLLKAILAQDLATMENLGIYEVIEEDFALCEFVCTSKINVQSILSQGLALIEEEG